MHAASTVLGAHSRNSFQAEIIGWTKAIAVATVALGLIVLSGWALNIEAFKRLLPGLVSMKANLAAAFVLSGISLHLHTLRQSTPAILLARRVTVIPVLLLGLVTLAEYSLGWDAGIDQLLFSEPAEALSTSHPGRMSTISAINLILIGSALLLMESMLWATAQAVASALLLLTLLPLGGYMFGNLSLTHIGNTTLISAPAVMGFMMLAAGILVATQNHGFIAQLRKRLLAVGLVTLLAVFILILGTASYNLLQKDKASQRVEHTYEVILGMESFSGSMHDFLYHNRGFLITGDERQSAESDKHRNAMLAKLASVQQLASDDPAQHERLGALDSLVKQRIGQADFAAQLQREKGHQAVAAIIATGESDALTDEIDAKLGELQYTERNLLKERQKIAGAINSSSLFTLVILLIACPLLLLWVFRTLQYEIAERKQKALELSKFKATIDSTDEAIIISTPNGIIESWNRGAGDLFGYTAGEAIGQPMQILISPDRLDECHETLARISCGERADRFETVRRHKEGHLIDVSTTISPVLNDEGKVVGISKIARNITERKQAELILRTSEEFTRLVLGAVGDGIVGMDTEGKITFANPAVFTLLGYSEEQLIGQPMHPLVHYAYPDGRDFPREECSMYRTSHDGQPRRVDNEVLWRKDGVALPVEYNTTPVIKDGQIVGSVIVFRDITERKESEETIWKQANFDVLTGLPNRHMFHDRLEQELKKAKRTNLPLALMLIDLDHFKEINDTLGHAMGDLLLKEAARRIGGCVRLTDTVVRLGGDEFVVILPDLDDINNIERIAQSIIQKVSEPYYLNEKVAYVSASIGITLYPDDAGTIEELFKNADQAMYVAKNQGRNRHGYFTAAMQEAVQTRLQLIHDLRGALAAGQFMVYFQPIVELATGNINKAEALIRWQHPGRGLVSPVQFIPLAEETGLILEIGDWVFHESMRWTKRWRDMYKPMFQVSVNKSPIQFYKDGDDHAAWLAHLREIDLPGQGLVIEITEGLLLDSNISINSALITLRNSNIQVSIDDFGTGYSSLSYLKKFDIDYLKIDRSFVRDLAIDPNDLALCEAIIVMAHKLGIKVIAEGVETQEQSDMLAAAGCDYAQGYLYSRPVPAEEFEELLK